MNDGPDLGRTSHGTNSASPGNGIDHDDDWPEFLFAVWDWLDKTNRHKLRGPWDEPDRNYRLSTLLCMRMLRHHGLSLPEVIQAAGCFPDGFGKLGGHASLIRDLWREYDEEMARAAEEARKPKPGHLTGNWWLVREITRPTPVLGEVICTSTRMLLGGPTGVGKSHVCLAMAGAIATGRGYLHWLGPTKPLTVLYIDGEMALDLIQDRIRDLHRRMGKPDFARLQVLCREDFPEMAGLNTQAGVDFMLAVIDQIKPAVVFLDNRMCLTSGDMKEEVTWTDALPFVLELTRRQIAQVWIDHTGHATDRIYGSSTKEWQMDVVAMLEALEQPDADIAVRLRFIKTRRRRPETRGDFASGSITLATDEWLWQPDEAGTLAKGTKRGRPISDETELLMRTIVNLAADESVVPTVVQAGMKPVRAVRLDIARVYLINNGWFTETLDYSEHCDAEFPSLTKKGHARLRNSLTTLERQGLCGFNRDVVWPL
jgi:hypothetical protein